MLKKIKVASLYHMVDGEKVSGQNPDMHGNCTWLSGNCTGLSGDVKDNTEK